MKYSLCDLYNDEEKGYQILGKILREKTPKIYKKENTVNELKKEKFIANDEWYNWYGIWQLNIYREKMNAQTHIIEL